MSDDRTHDPDEPFAWSSLVVRGTQSATFLQGQLSQDLDTIGAQGGWSALLTPSSEVLATCFVTIVEGGYELLVARAVGDAALARLKRFHLRVDCTIALNDALRGPYNTIGEQIERGEPGPSEFLGLSPQCYGQSFVERTVSFTKGCFTGQELVARLDARGANVPWRFVRATGPTREAIAQRLVASGPATGASLAGVTSAVRRDRGVDALGFVHRSALDTPGDDEHGVRVRVIA
ncbi:MAG: hypothetical protein WAN30_05470 [Acidimicrobiales bacterium]